MDDAVELADFIGQLRAQLSSAMRSGSEEPLQFEIGPLELELTVVVQRDRSANGKVQLWVLEGGGQRSYSSVVTQRIKLTLDARVRGADDLRVRVAGSELLGEK